MGHYRHRQILTALCVAILLALPHAVSACPNCYGNPDEAATQGMNFAILSLLGITSGVLVAFGAFFLQLRRRARSLHDRLNTLMN
jgi:hypothetical protein